MTEERFEKINVRKLAIYLAEQNWNKDIEGKREQDIYDLEVSPEVINGISTGNTKMEKVVKAEYAVLFWQLVEQYQRIIETFTPGYESNKEEDSSYYRVSFN